MGTAWHFGRSEAGGPSITCDLRPTCQYHPTTSLTLMAVKGLEFPLSRANGETHAAHAFDVEMICPKCNLFAVFGVAVKPEDFASCQ